MLKEFPKLIRVCEIISKYSIYALVFFLPILFLPWTSDFLDFNKQAFLALFLLLALFSWMAKVLISGKLSINFTKTNIAVLIFFLACLASTIFSQNRYGSFWGWPSVASESLLTVTGLAVLYFLISSAFSKKEIYSSIKILAFSGIAAVLIGILQILRIYISFNTIGTMGSLGIFAAVLLPLLIALEIRAKKWLKIIFFIGILLEFALFVLINYPVVWWIVLISCSLFMLFSMLKKDIFDLRWLGLPMFFLVLALFFLILRPQIPISTRTVEIYLNQATTFDIALQTLKSSPIFGSGPGTFVFDFSKYKKVEFNQGALWNARFDQGGSKILTLLAVLGIFGFVSFLALIAAVLFSGLKFILLKKDNYSLATAGAIFIGFFSLVVGYFLYGSNISLEFLFFFLIACFAGLALEEKKEYLLNPSSFLTLGITFVFTLFFIFGLGLLFLNSQRYLAEINYYKGISKFQSGQKEQGLKKLEVAVSLNSNSDLYLRQLSQAYLSRLADVVNDKNLSEEEKNQNIQLLVNNSINAAKMSTDVNPKNISNWSIRGYVYQSLIGLVPGSEDWALKSYEQAATLDPANPYYPTQEGITYLTKTSTVDKNDANKKNEDLKNAKSLFDKSIGLKSDYAAARFELAMVYQAQGETEQEVQALEDAKKNSPNDIGLLFQIGLVYYQEGNYDKARSNLELAVNNSPDYSNALYFLGLAYSKLGQTQKAIETFQKVAGLNPDNTEIPKIISNLKAGKSALFGIIEETPAQAPVQETPPEKQGK